MGNGCHDTKKHKFSKFYDGHYYYDLMNEGNRQFCRIIKGVSLLLRAKRQKVISKHITVFISLNKKKGHFASTKGRSFEDD